jgi:hypothetical protein
MKLSWSYRITFLYLGFVGIIVTLVTISSRNKEELVAKDYYAQELAYQEQINAIKNEKELVESIQHSVKGEGVELALPASIQEIGSGQVSFYCPSNSKNDLTVKMTFKEGKQLISRNALNSGIYKLRLSWTMGPKKYFKEEVITIK